MHTTKRMREMLAKNDNTTNSIFAPCAILVLSSIFFLSLFSFTRSSVSNFLHNLQEKGKDTKREFEKKEKKTLSYIAFCKGFTCKRKSFISEACCCRLQQEEREREKQSYEVRDGVRMKKTVYY